MEVKSIPGKRLVQVRIDHDSLFTNPHNTFNLFPGECQGAWRETSKKTKKLHYHAMYVVDESIKRVTYESVLKKVLKADAPQSGKCIKFYNSRNFNNGETFAYYIGYCSKCQDPIIDNPNVAQYLEIYQKVNLEKSSDEVFKDFVLKRLTDKSTDEQIVQVICEWYQYQGTQHSPLIGEQRYWQVLALINPDKHSVNYVSATLKLIKKYS